LKVLFVDLETAPCLSWVWGMYEQNVIDVKKSWYILAFAYKWQGEKKIHTKAITDFKQADPEDDYGLCKKLHSLISQADLVVAHNGKRFDRRKSHARFIKHNLPPCTHIKWYDTLQLARAEFGFLSNKLNDLGAYLNIGRKLPHTGFDLWKRCMRRERKAIKKMKAYNARDVWLLEKVFDRLKPWAKRLPDAAEHECNSCLSTHLNRRGPVRKSKTRFQFVCRECGHWQVKTVETKHGERNRRRS